MVEQMGIYVIQDVIADEVGPLFEAKNDLVALRQYSQIVEKNNLKTNEFRLLMIGTVNRNNSQVELISGFRVVSLSADAESELIAKRMIQDMADGKLKSSSTLLNNGGNK
ncbi:MAG TPA: hypothetical protein VHO70_05825 [Chitinispirillaceae bacterium]|nr:hypothetical protein [Chitinispirillaceae bacterium]